MGAVTFIPVALDTGAGVTRDLSGSASHADAGRRTAVRSWPRFDADLDGD